MAIDTAAKRSSSLDHEEVWSAGLPIPDGSATQGDRQHLAFSYSGILVGSFVVATTYTFSGPAYGVVGIASSVFTVTPDGDADGITVTPATDGSGTFTPASVTFSGSDPETFTYTPTSIVGTPHTLTVTNDGGLTDPAAITFVVSAFETATDILQEGADWLQEQLADYFEDVQTGADSWLAEQCKEWIAVSAIYRRGSDNVTLRVTLSSAFDQSYDGAPSAVGRKLYLPAGDLTFDDGATRAVPAAGDTIEWLDQFEQLVTHVLVPWGRNNNVAESLDGGLTWGVTVQPQGSLTPRKTVLVSIEQPVTPRTKNAFGEVTSGYVAAGVDIYAELIPEPVREEQDAGRTVGVQSFKALVTTPAYAIRSGWRVKVKSGTYLDRYLYVERVGPVEGHSTETLIECRMGNA